MLLGSTVVLRRSFDPEACLDVVEAEHCDSMVVIPVMLQRILALPDEALATHDLSHVKVVASSGSALPGDLALAWMDRFGDHLYNIYGSTEVAYASIADPADLRAAPSAAGKPPYATVVRILGPDRRELPRGETGLIFVGNGLLFEGYTGGGSKEVVDGLMATGDVGRFDADGRLHVEGRDDEMIVSGGENVFPQEVEDCLVAAPGGRRGGRDRGARRRVRPAAPGVRRASGRRGRRPRTSSRSTSASTWPASRCPARSCFLAELPRNATGKVLKRELDAD